MNKKLTFISVEAEFDKVSLKPDEFLLIRLIDQNISQESIMSFKNTICRILEGKGFNNPILVYTGDQVAIIKGKLEEALIDKVIDDVIQK